MKRHFLKKKKNYTAQPDWFWCHLETTDKTAVSDVNWTEVIHVSMTHVS